MKTYHFKTLLQAGGFIVVYLSVIIYGFIWLGRETNIDDKIYTVRSELIGNITAHDAEFNGRIIEEISDLERRMQPSAFRGRK